MRSEKEIVGEYKKADFNDRVFLFVTHRDLRDEFMDIELHAYQNLKPNTTGDFGAALIAKERFKNNKLIKTNAK